MSDLSDNDPLRSSEMYKELCRELDDEDDYASDCGSNLDGNGPNSLQMIFSNSNNNSITNTSVDFMDIDLEDPPSFVQHLLSIEPIAEPNTDCQTNNNQSYDNQLHDNLIEIDQHQPYDDQPDNYLFDNDEHQPDPELPLDEAVEEVGEEAKDEGDLSTDNQLYGLRKKSSPNRPLLGWF
ncbi:hypothetical protein J6590_099736 [Homalodisca vitripennis]|nr:hypothetical protein J6590_099736 [Homalodisca vitripennis]